MLDSERVLKNKRFNRLVFNTYIYTYLFHWIHLLMSISDLQDLPVVLLSYVLLQFPVPRP